MTHGVAVSIFYFAQEKYCPARHRSGNLSATSRAVCNAVSRVRVRRYRQAASGAGKSLRKWPPRLSHRRSAATAISNATSAGSAAGPADSARGSRVATDVARSSWVRSTPAARDRIDRTASGSAAAGILMAMPSRSRPAGAAATLAATDSAPTTASSSELLASRLARAARCRRPRHMPTGQGACYVRANLRRCHPCGNGRPDALGSAASSDQSRTSRRQRR
jgi:hypothetical protein